MNALGIFRKSAPPTPQWDDRDSSEKTRLGQRVSCKALVQGWGWTHRNWTDVTPIDQKFGPGIVREVYLCVLMIDVSSGVLTWQETVEKAHLGSCAQGPWF